MTYRSDYNTPTSAQISYLNALIPQTGYSSYDEAYSGVWGGSVHPIEELDRSEVSGLIGHCLRRIEENAKAARRAAREAARAAKKQQ